MIDGYRAPTRTRVVAPPSLPTTLGAVINGGGDAGHKHHASLVPEALAHAWVVSGDSRLWWEAVVLGREAGGGLLAGGGATPRLPGVGATLWFLGALLLQLHYAPYTKRLFNRLEVVSLIATLLTAVISTTLLQYNVGVTTSQLHPPDAMTGIEWTVTVLLAALNVGTIVVLAGYWLRLQCAHAHHIVRRASMAAGVRASLERRQSSAAPGDVKVLEAFMVNPLRAGAGSGTGVAARLDVVAGQDTSVPAPAAVKVAPGSAAVAKTRLVFGPAPIVGTATSPPSASSRPDGTGAPVPTPN